MWSYKDSLCPLNFSATSATFELLFLYNFLLYTFPSHHISISVFTSPLHAIFCYPMPLQTNHFDPYMTTGRVIVLKIFLISLKGNTSRCCCILSLFYLFHIYYITYVLVYVAIAFDDGPKVLLDKKSPVRVTPSKAIAEKLAGPQKSQNSVSVLGFPLLISTPSKAIGEKLILLPNHGIVVLFYSMKRNE